MALRPGLAAASMASCVCRVVSAQNGWGALSVGVAMRRSVSVLVMVSAPACNAANWRGTPPPTAGPHRPATRVPAGESRSINATSARADSTACTGFIPAAGVVSAVAMNHA